MANEWYEMSEKEMLIADSETKELKRLTYHNVFYATEEGRQVLADLRRRAYSSGGLVPEAVVAIIELLKYIRDCCGVTNEKSIIDAEAEVVAPEGEEGEEDED